MQPNVAIMERTGDLGGEKTAMTFDENSIAHIMSVLTDLYSDPEMAVIREYSTNARDSHIAAGVDLPIEITLPSQFSPFFRVRDYGLGMSVEDVVNIYSKYGASTKRGTNEQTGMLGLGCKSALTYTNQFTVVAIKDGVKASVSISRVEDGTGVVEIVDTTTTDERNGVEIVIPVKRMNGFSPKTHSFFSYWPEGTVLVDGEKPNISAITEDAIEVIPNVWLIPDQHTSHNDVIVMGGVAYPLVGEKIYWSNSYRHFYVIAFVEMGAVNFTPSREALHMTNLTKATIESIRTSFKNALLDKARSEVSAQPTHADAFKEAMKWRGLLGSSQLAFSYKGAAIPDRFPFTAMEYTRYASRNAVKHRSSVILYGAEVADGKFLFVTDFEPSDVTRTHRQKVGKWIDDNDKSLSIRTVYFLRPGDGVPGTPWTDNVKTVPWSEIRAIKLNDKPREKRESMADKYEVYQLNGYTASILAEDIGDNKPVYFVRASECSWYGDIGRLMPLIGDCDIVRVPSNREAKFRRIFPQAQHITEVMDMLKDKVKGLATETDLVYNSLVSSHRFFIKNVAHLVDDPEVKALNAAIVDAESPDGNDRRRHYYNLVDLMRTLGVEVESEKTDVLNIEDRYPLLVHMYLPSVGTNKACLKEVAIYMNAVFAAM